MCTVISAEGPGGVVILAGALSTNSSPHEAPDRCHRRARTSGDELADKALAGNRDESHARAAALPPTVAEVEGVGVLWPRDPEGGGTWTAVTTAGLGFSLLNDYQSAWRPGASARSRGLVIPQLVGALEPGEVVERLESSSFQAGLSGMGAFTLRVVADGGRGGLRVVWRGAGLQVEAWSLPGLAVSSGWEVSRAEAVRGEALAALLSPGAALDGEAIKARFSSHAGGPGPWSVCMHGPFSRTVSHTQAFIHPDHVVMRYFEGQPCEVEASSVELRLERLSGAGSWG